MGNDYTVGEGVGGNEVANASRHKSQEHPCNEIRDEPVEYIISNVSIVVAKLESKFRFSIGVFITDGLVV